MKPTVVLKTYFGLLEGQTLGDFAKEIRVLSPEEKAWLVAEAAKELGVEVDA